jgi:hypothetical protein
MFLWNVSKVEDLEDLAKLSQGDLRKKLRIAQLIGHKLYYVKPVRIRTGLLGGIVIDCYETTKPYGASDTLYELPKEVTLLIRKRE